MSAKDTFHHPDFGHNCAQAIAYQFKNLYDDEQIVEKLAAFGGGRAPQGLCGALYAAQLACPAHKTEVEEAFYKAAGASTCREIKQMVHTPCLRCLEIAEMIVEKYK